MKLLEKQTVKIKTIAHQIEFTPQEGQTITASLSNLIKILPESEIKSNPNFEYYAGDLAVGSVINKNDDGITIEDAVRVYKKFEGTPIDVEHISNKVVGYIVKSTLTNPETREILTEEEALNFNAPINISIAFIIWSRVDEGLSSVLEEVSDETSPSHGLISLSWEMSFDEYYLVAGSRNILEAKIIDNDEEISALEGNLRFNGGNGFMADGETSLYRVVTGANLLPLGAGLVVKPAAQVKGIIKIEPLTNGSEFNNIDSHVDNFLLNSNFEEVILIDKLKEMELNAGLEKSSQLEPNTVKRISMKIKNINEINDETMKEISASELTSFITEELVKKATEHDSVVAAKDNELKEVKDSGEKAIAKAVELSGEVEVLKAKIQEIEDVRAAEKAENDYNVRMTSLDSEFELGDDDRKVVASQIKGLDDDSFTSWKSSFDVIAKEKNKEFIKNKFVKKEDEKEVKEKEEAKYETKASEKDPLDLVKENKVKLPTTVIFAEDVIAKYRAAFSLEKGVTFTK